jgi:hypothetical protein
MARHRQGHRGPREWHTDELERRSPLYSLAIYADGSVSVIPGEDMDTVDMDEASRAAEAVRHVVMPNQAL